MLNCSFDIWEQNLKLIDKYSLCINVFSVSDKNFQKLIELHRDKLARLQICDFCFYKNEYEISEGAINMIREIHPTYFEKSTFQITFQELKAACNTNSKNIEFYFEEIWDAFGVFTFLNSRFLLFDSIDNQKLFFECESVTFCFEMNGFEKMHLVKTDKDSHADSNLK